MFKRAMDVTLVILLMGGSSVVVGDELAKRSFKVQVQETYSVATKQLQMPFWTKTIPQASNGRITASVTPLEQIGVDDKALLRLLGLGVFEFGTMDLGKFAGDDPRFEGCDLSGISIDVATARKACAAYRPVLSEIMEKNWNAKLLGLSLDAPQVFWCKSKISGLDDLKGKKIRVSNRTMADFLKAIGAEPVSINYAEVIPALQSGVVDCAVTGPLSANTGGWTEVTNYVYPVSLGWSVRAYVANLATWNGLDAKTQQFLTKEFDKLDDKGWGVMEAAITDYYNCDLGQQPCTMGKLANVKLAPVSDKDKETAKRLVESVVVQNWAKRAGPKAAQQWNDTVGQVLGMKVTAN